MYKNTIINAKMKLPEHYHVKKIPLPKGKRKIHESYGLWICKIFSKIVFPGRNEIHPRAFDFYCISHLVEGTGWYWSRKRGSITPIETGQGVISAPGFVQFYTGYNCAYVEDSICFAGPVADMLFKTGIIKNGVIDIGLNRRLMPIIDIASDPSSDSQIKANSMLVSLLTELYLENRKNKNSSLLSKIDELLGKMTSNPENNWSIKEMAEYCNLSVNHFRRIFYKQTGLKPKEYQDTIKTEQAKMLICSSENSISSIAETLGYSDQYHFSRRFKEITGLSPSKFRIEFFKTNFR
ncbi:MAG: hypothetical protein A2020_06220 [Lentisphaerae bacterium GWF2_45_14]|nr:MAG: hypothetical protein A2020_06220 [Lentisphaerae bacterium GWF2_45_14]